MVVLTLGVMDAGEESVAIPDLSRLWGVGGVSGEAPGARRAAREWYVRRVKLQ